MKLLNILIVVYLNSCGQQQENKSTSSGVKNKAPVATIIQDMDQVHTCDKAHHTQLIYVVDESAFYSCIVTSGWVPTENPL